jgi:hypothetical protein
MLRGKAHRLADIVSQEGVSSGIQAVHAYVRTKPKESIYSFVGRLLVSSSISRAELIERGGSDFPIHTYGEQNNFIFSLPKGNAKKQWETAFDLKARYRPDIVSPAAHHKDGPAYRVRTPAEAFCVVPDVTLFGSTVIPRTDEKRILKENAGNIDRILKTQLHQHWKQMGHCS